MRPLRLLLLVVPLLLAPAANSRAEVSIDVGIGIELPGVEIGVHIPAYPRLMRIPGHPVLYAPHLHYNLFFFDGLYWIFIDDHWYVSVWYDGPWDRVDPYEVPLFLLRVPVRYYRHPPPYFRHWHRDNPPHWGEHWGPTWEERHKGWHRWEPHAAPPPAPPPSYQRKYRGEHYPRERERQESIRSERYRYQPRDEASRRHMDRHKSKRSEGGGPPHGR